MSRSLRRTGEHSGSPGHRDWHGGLGRREPGPGADDFESTPTTPVTWPPPCRGTIVVPTVTAPVRVEEQADRARNVPLPESNPCLRDLFLMTNGCLNARKERCATEV